MGVYIYIYMCVYVCACVVCVRACACLCVRVRACVSVCTCRCVSVTSRPSHPPAPTCTCRSRRTRCRNTGTASRTRMRNGARPTSCAASTAWTRACSCTDTGSCPPSTHVSSGDSVGAARYSDNRRLGVAPAGSSPSPLSGTCWRLGTGRWRSSPADGVRE